MQTGAARPEKNRRRRIINRACIIVAGALVIGLTQASASAQNIKNPEEIGRKLGFDDTELKKIQHGEIVRKALKEVSETEIAGVVAAFFPQPVSKLASGELTGEFLNTNDPASQFRSWTPDESPDAAFSSIGLAAKEAEEAKKYSHDGPGEGLNLSSAEINQFKKSGEDLAAVNSVLRSVLKARYESYRRAGLKGVAPYSREKNRTVWPGDELRQAVTELMKTTQQQDFFRALLSYPANPLQDMEHRFYLFKQLLEGRPAFILEHRAGLLQGEVAAIVTEERFYVSHNYNANLITSYYVAGQDGTFIFCTNRSFSDQLAGFGSSLKRAIGRQMMLSELAKRMQHLRDKLKQVSPK
jgi:hypothetical protein